MLKYFGFILLFAEQTAGLQCCVCIGRQLFGLLVLLVEGGDVVPRLGLVQCHPLVIQLLLLHLDQVRAPVQTKLNHILQQFSVLIIRTEPHTRCEIQPDIASEYFSTKLKFLNFWTNLIKLE